MSSIPAYVVSSSSAFGSRTVPSEEVDAAFGMPSGKLKDRAGIVSLAYALENEDEGALATRACAAVLQQAGESASGVDCIVASSETYHAYPSLAAVLHARLGLREGCGALDAGSGCLALLQALAVAQSMLVSGRGEKILVATADVHSRTLGPGRARGEFGGLFGDGASAFLLQVKPTVPQQVAWKLGEFFFGCAAQYAEAISICEAEGGRLDIQFDGEALSRAAVNRMEKILSEVERRSGFARAAVAAFATHQPNPRLVTLLAKQLGAPASLFPPICATRGNLGSSMCGAALHEALKSVAFCPEGKARPVFLASLGPGLLFGGGWVEPASA